MKKIILTIFLGVSLVCLIAQKTNYSFTTGINSNKVQSIKWLKSYQNEKINYHIHEKNNYLIVFEKSIPNKKNKPISILIGLGINREKYITFDNEKYLVSNTNIFAAFEKVIDYQKKDRKAHVKYFGTFGVGLSFDFNNENFVDFYKVRKNRINLAYQFSPINLQFKMYKNWYLKCGLGYGYKGIIHTGIVFMKK